MGMQEFLAAVEMMNQYPSLQYFAGQRDEDLILNAEKALGVTFPSSYRAFVLKFGAGNFGATEIYGVIDDEFQESAIPDGVWLTLRYRREYRLPEPFIIVYNDGFGSDFALDTREVTDNGESPVIILPVGSYASIDDNQEMETAAPDFGSFFLNLVNPVCKFTK